ncbi:MAG: ATP-binding protein [Lachnospiraceae bacterium]|nr:ATP-binding protein [Lachnospiraceae bacterium]
MNQNPASESGKCDLCKGSGWQLYRGRVFDYGEPMDLDFAKKCPKCSGILRSQDRTGVPDEFREADIQKFNFTAYSVDITKLKNIAWSMLNDYKRWSNYGKGLYLWSKTPGSGKTFLACCIGKSIMIKHDQQMRFITAPDYISLVGESYKRERGEQDSSSVYRECSILILDDIGTQIDKEWQRQEIFRLVNHRMANGLITIYTSNSPVERLNVEERTMDRIIKTSVVLQMPEESIRRKKARNEQNQFLEAINGIN